MLESFTELVWKVNKTYIHIYIYIYRERERAREMKRVLIEQICIGQSKLGKIIGQSHKV